MLECLEYIGFSIFQFFHDAQYLSEDLQLFLSWLDSDRMREKVETLEPDTIITHIRVNHIKSFTHATRLECILENCFTCLNLNTYCGYSKEPSQGYDSFEHPNACLNWWVRKKLQFYAQRVSYSEPMFHGFLHSFLFFLSLYTAKPSFEYYLEVYFVHSVLQDESLKVTISKLP